MSTGNVGTLTLRASAALTASATGTTVSAAVLNHPDGSPTANDGLQHGALFVLSCTTSAGTNRRLFVNVMGVMDNGDTAFPICTFGGVTSTSIQRIPYDGPLPPYLFTSATVNGTASPSFTFSVKAVALGT